MMGYRLLLVFFFCLSHPVLAVRDESSIRNLEGGGGGKNNDGKKENEKTKPSKMNTQQTAPPKEEGSGSLARKTMAPTRRPVAPTRRPVAPTRRPVIPTRRPITPTRRPITPTRRPLTPTPRPVTPTPRPVTPTPRKTASPTEKPVTAPPPPPAPDNICRAATCTKTVLDAMACSDSYGGCFTCGSRITYMIDVMRYSVTSACKTIGFDQFPNVCGGCLPDDFRIPVPPVDPTKLVWSDEFNYEGVPDPKKWTYDIGTGIGGWGNNELQYYTDLLDNAYVKDGSLYIRARKENFEGKAYTSARIKTLDKADWKYGRIRIRTRLSNASARGTWSAHWMLPTEDKYGIWPDSGEIDIMEHVGYDAGKIYGTIHCAAFNHMIGTQDVGQMTTKLDDWHIYDIDWSEDKIDFFLDGSRYHVFNRQPSSTYREWPFDHNFHLILNIAVGGDWGGLKGIDEAAFEGNGQVMEVDWVRVYSR